jgi:hypothetical protein
VALAVVQRLRPPNILATEACGAAATMAWPPAAYVLAQAWRILIRSTSEYDGISRFWRQGTDQPRILMVHHTRRGIVVLKWQGGTEAWRAKVQFPPCSSEPPESPEGAMSVRAAAAAFPTGAPADGLFCSGTSVKTPSTGELLRGHVGLPGQGRSIVVASNTFSGAQKATTDRRVRRTHGFSAGTRCPLPAPVPGWKAR